jgi:DNA excision repair protein ERCC-2
MKNFPYPFREGQEEALSFIAKNQENLCIDAPTGFGKTPVILVSLINKSHPVIWAVRTGNEADRPIEELKVINKVSKKKFFGFSFRGKRDMCLAAREKGLSETDAIAYFCRTYRARCPYYENLSDYVIRPTRPLIYSEIIQLCREVGVCPYYLQRELLYHADLVSLSYNYIIHPGMSWVIRSVIPFKACYLVVDEAHNLRLVGNINSDQITLNTFKNSIKELDELGELELKNIVLEIMGIVEEIYRNMLKKNEEERIVDMENFVIYAEYLPDLKKVGETVRRRRLDEGKAPRSSSYHLASFFLDSFEFIGKDGITFIATAESNNLIIERWDMRGAEILRDAWKQFRKCVFCSGTLKPMDAFAETIGLEDWRGKSFSTELGKSRTLIIKGLSTRGEELSKQEVEKYTDIIETFIEINANLAIFSASYRIQNDLLPSLKKIAKKIGKRLYIERQGMQGDEGRRILDGFKENGGILVAPMTGRFAEGADFPGKELEGVFLVGIPFDRLTLRTKLYIEYYKRLYGEEKGWYYSYVIPALQRASQALGRALRSKDDKALFVLGDERYKERIYSRLLPNFVRPEIVEHSEAKWRIIESWKELEKEFK